MTLHFTYLCVAEVPGVAEDLSRDIVLSNDVYNQFVILEKTISENFHPPKILKMIFLLGKPSKKKLTSVQNFEMSTF